MCGIVGYLGARDPKDVIIAGLRKLEYRGYDSAGLAVFDHQVVRRIRAEGKLKNLEAKLESQSFSGPSGIGHTRWATHGGPSERNAHPHQSGLISLVHNGIIENYNELKQELSAAGVPLESDTDSEIVAHLINQKYQQYQNLLDAVRNVLPHLKGAFSIVVMAQDRPDELVAFKDGPPLILGIGHNEHFVVSDVAATLQYTNRYIYLDDREIVHLEGHNYRVMTQAGIELKKQIHTIEWSPEVVEKRGFSHFMLKEIYEQAQSVAQAINPHLSTDRQQIFLNQNLTELEKLLEGIERVIIVACGTSYYAGLSGQYLIEKFAKLNVQVEVASEFRYRDPVLNQKCLFISISQSGETADTLAALRLAKQSKIKTLSICNVKGSSIDREADFHVYMNCGPEIGVASTKAFTSTLVVIQLIALSFAKIKKQISGEQEKDWVLALLQLPSQIEVVLAFDKYFTDASEALRRFKGFLFMGRGFMYPIALEGALKMKELTYLHAEGYPAGEMKHGPLALIDENMAVVMLAPKDELYDKTVSNLQEVKARGAKIISIGSGDDEHLRAMSDRYLAIPQVNSWIDPILAVIPLQLMAFHLAQSLGYDVDQPRNLAKSVTVE
jgi:glutamine---fructose-6-phosphate transaminase (isomerizing)